MTRGWNYYPDHKPRADGQYMCRLRSPNDYVLEMVLPWFCYSDEDGGTFMPAEHDAMTTHWREALDGELQTCT